MNTLPVVRFHSTCSRFLACVVLVWVLFIFAAGGGVQNTVLCKPIPKVVENMPTSHAPGIRSPERWSTIAPFGLGRLPSSGVLVTFSWLVLGFTFFLHFAYCGLVI